MNIENDHYLGRVKYTEKQAWKYRVHKPVKHRAEMRMLDRAFSLVPRGSHVLDSPCGTGRAAIHLAALGYRMTCADLSQAMIDLTRDMVEECGLDTTVERQDVEDLTYEDRTFDAVLCFRLFHHFPTETIRRRVIRELSRVAKHQVVLSYFSPLSPTSWKRILKARWQGVAPDKFPTRRSEVSGYFQEQGFVLLKDVARTRFLHTMHVAVFERRA